MAEVQIHGFTFEKWVCETFFDGHTGSYMRKWDVAPEANYGPAIPVPCRGLPVSIKTAKYGSPIGLGDILRQRQIDVPFLMIVGFWRQRTLSEKWIEDIGVAEFSLEKWSDLWGRLSLDHLRSVDLVVKNMDSHYSEVRRQAREWKKTTPEVSSSSFVVNPKIDSKSQRRIQCSLPSSVFWTAVGRAPQRLDAPELWGVPFPNPMSSSARSFGG